MAAAVQHGFDAEHEALAEEMRMRNFKVKLIETFTVTRETIVGVEAESLQEAVESCADGTIAPPEFEHPGWSEFWSPNEEFVVGAMLPDAAADGARSPDKSDPHRAMTQDEAKRAAYAVEEGDLQFDPHELSGLNDAPF